MEGNPSSSAFRKECIIHELLHLKLPNHANLFKALLKAYSSQGIEVEPVVSRRVS